jgi:hypothetical protein
MISNEDKYKLLKITKEYNISKRYLFSSNNKQHSTACDLAVKQTQLTPLS